MGKPNRDQELEQRTEEILTMVENGFYDYEIYKALHVSSETFRKWREAHRSAYDDAKKAVYTNLLRKAESGLQAKIEGVTLKEETVEYDEHGQVKKRIVKTKDTAPDSLAIMFALKSADMERYDPVQFRRLALEEKSDDKIQEVIESLQGYSMKEIQAPKDVTPDDVEDLLNDIS